jgi:hypothetical protein
VVLTTVRPAVRLRIEGDLESRQHTVAVSHDICIGKADDTKSELAKHLSIPQEITLAVMGAAVDFYRKALLRAKQVDNPKPDHILAAKLVAKESLRT